jgi:S-adenosylmethionine decarboxylase proenzyme
MSIRGKLALHYKHRGLCSDRQGLVGFQSSRVRNDQFHSKWSRHSVASGTLLYIHLHRFGDGGGISRVAVLAESHISVHTWPEKGFAAFDVFMCGNAEFRSAGRIQARLRDG